MPDSIAAILTPYDINRLTLRNRLAVAPMTRVSATQDGKATDAMARYYERFAKGGFGLVITEGIYTDRQFSQGYPFQPGITDPEQARAWRVVTDRIHAHHSAAFAQIMHAGALSQANRFSDHTIAPSSVQPKGEQMRFYFGEGSYPVPKAMTDEDIADAIAGFAQSAKRSVTEAGFDGIEIHGANGYLLDQFLTDYANQRGDRWGGSTHQRIQLTLEVVKAVRVEVGAVPVGVRISQGKVNDFQHKWAGGEADAEVIFGSLQDSGVDFIHVTEFEAWKPAFTSNSASLIELARRYAPTPALIANGGLHAPEHLDTALSDGANIIALGKAALANPDFPSRLLEGKPLAPFDASILGPIANIKAGEFEA
ncbi:MAG: NADH:flavin oxidoreductase [Candidatus Pseudomonas phytovorans]|uniref:NADH:flavin oxidoreductase n=1 Tax=Candidatus Pseudomonas phytovorans TaxID=3121377 RepID=A0AAJ5WGL8_9PSED|nr:NADH:flavin oxidoreductase [Pseudomonas sp.]WEK29369.1 MAG: NADH:flavin oxidoreductase [Pseudomonas sp.]